MLETLRELNPGLPFYSVSDPEFAAYGRVVDGMDLSDLAAAVADLPMPDGTVLATVRPAVFEFEKAFSNALNQKSIVLFGENGVKGYDVIDYDSFDLGDAAETEFPANDLVKWNYAQGCIGVKDRKGACGEKVHGCGT